MYSSHIKWLSLGLALFVGGCGDPSEFRFGENITGIQFELFDEEEGIHPSKVVLLNPRNPFRRYNISEDTKFDILVSGGNAGAFYAWATLLANIPTGEHQFFTATKLRDIFLSNEVPVEDRPIIRQMAIEGFQRVLDCFPESVTFDVTGTFSRKLATLAFLEILDLGGAPLGDWILATDSNGNPVAIQSSAFPGGGREVNCL